jgi:PAS domain S-box-containing protein
VKLRARESADVLEADTVAGLHERPEFTAVFEALPDGLVVVDADGGLRLMNASAESICGVARADVLGKSLAVLADASTLDWTELVDAFHARRRAEVVLHTPADRVVLTSVRFLRDARRNFVAALFVQRDLDVLAHQRRAAEGGDGHEVFRFRGPGDHRPDFDLQRRLSPALDRVLEWGERALRQGARVLLTGESGSGKSRIARHLQALTRGSSGPFVHVNCAAIPDSLFESELFGYERGSFTGALHGGKKGLIEEADGGTLFLDEVGEIPLAAQAKLLRFLEDQTVQRIGSGTSRRINVQVITATNRDLGERVAAAAFRQDLFFRIAVISLEVPPLREQPGLLSHLIDHYLDQVSRARGRPLALSDECRECLLAYRFPGNIRELHNLIQQLSVKARDRAGADLLPPHVREPGSGIEPTGGADSATPAETLRGRVQRYERLLIEEAILRHGSKRRAAKALGVDIGTVVRKTQRGP